jgi:hypothetical protein
MASGFSIKDHSQASIVTFTSNCLSRARITTNLVGYRENSNSAHQHQDQQNYDNEAQAAAAVIAGTVKWRASKAADATEKN